MEQIESIKKEVTKLLKYPDQIHWSDFFRNLEERPEGLSIYESPKLALMVYPRTTDIAISMITFYNNLSQDDNYEEKSLMVFTPKNEPVKIHIRTYLPEKNDLEILKEEIQELKSQIQSIREIVMSKLNK